jgi:hypothetical protein
MSVSEAQLAEILANLGQPTTPPTSPMPTPALPRPKCRACPEPLDPALIDQPDNTGLHLLCTEPDTQNACDDPFCHGTDRECGRTPQQHLQAATTIEEYTRPLHPPTAAAEQPGTDAEPPSTVAELRTLLIDYEANSARSLQTTIGPSEIGIQCQRALAYRLRNTPEQPDLRVPWAPIQGTAVHAYIAELLTAHNTQLGRQRWIIEERVWPDAEISGSGDAYDTDTGTVIDWKHAGDNSIAKYRKQMRPEYQVQAHLYGLGHERAGRDVRWVRVVCLNRSHDYDKSWEWTERYNPEIAIRALMRMYATQDLVNSLGLAANPTLWGAVPSQPSPECRYCRYFRPHKPPAADGCPGDIADRERSVNRFTDGLIA